MLSDNLSISTQLFRNNLLPIILLTCTWVLLPFNQSLATDLMLPQTYTEQVDLTGWLMSEKLDGVRGYWNGTQLLSKNGNRLYPSVAFTEQLPPFPVEGELWGGRNSFEQTVSIVKRQQPHDGWLQLTFAIFDVPQAAGGFIERIAKATDWFEVHPSRYSFVIPQIPIQSKKQMQQELQRIEDLAGEGLIVRKPDALYQAGRSTKILKVKNFQDEEATVLAHLPGKKRNRGRMGALLVENENGLKFRIGSGFTDEERESPPPVGTTITFKHYGRYQSGIPKFPTFMRVREDHKL